MQSSKSKLMMYSFIAVFIAGCVPYKTSRHERLIWSDNDHSIAYVLEDLTHYPLSTVNYDVEKSKVMVTHSQSFSDGVLLFEDDNGSEIIPLYYSDLHQILVYAAEYRHSFELQTFSLSDNTMQISELNLHSPAVASLSPNGQWIALYQNSRFLGSEMNTMAIVFVNTDDLQKYTIIHSDIPVPENEPPPFHWQGNNTVWVTHESGYAVFDLTAESITEQATGCIKPATHSSNINSQGLKVSVTRAGKEKLTITQKKPIVFCDS